MYPLQDQRLPLGDTPVSVCGCTSASLLCKAKGADRLRPGLGAHAPSAAGSSQTTGILQSCYWRLVINVADWLPSLPGLELRTRRRLYIGSPGRCCCSLLGVATNHPMDFSHFFLQVQHQHPFCRRHES